MSTAESTNSKGQDKLVVLEDFWAAYQLMPLRAIGADEAIEAKVVQPFRDGLRKIFSDTDCVDVEEVRKDVGEILGEGSFVITLEGGMLVPRYDVGVEITRACSSLREAEQGPYIRLPREYAAHLGHQAAQVRDTYRSTGGGQPIIIVDDGIGTGSSLREIVIRLRQQHVHPDNIVVVTNPNEIASIEDVDVFTIYKFEQDYIWLNERDFFWGLPRSGLSYFSKDKFLPIGGIPYSFSDTLIEQRVGVVGAKARRLRNHCLEFNLKLWEILEEHWDRPLRIEECSRLAFLVGMLDRTNERVIDLLEESKSSNWITRTTAEPDTTAQ